MTITIELTDLDEKCMRYAAASPEEWVKNLVDSRVYAAKKEIYDAEIRRMTEDPNIDIIPANIDEVVANAQVRYADEEPELPIAPDAMI